MEGAQTGAQEGRLPGAVGPNAPASPRIGDRAVASARRWRRWRVLGRADRAAAGMVALAIVLTGLSLLRGPPDLGNPAGFVVIAPLVAVAFLIALIAMFLERERHGLVRALLILSTAILFIAGIAYEGRAPTGTLIFAYWLPAILGVASLIAIARAKRTAQAAEGRPLS